MLIKQKIYFAKVVSNTAHPYANVLQSSATKGEQLALSYLYIIKSCLVKKSGHPLQYIIRIAAYGELLSSVFFFAHSCKGRISLANEPTTFPPVIHQCLLCEVPVSGCHPIITTHQLYSQHLSQQATGAVINNHPSRFWVKFVKILGPGKCWYSLKTQSVSTSIKTTR